MTISDILYLDTILPNTYLRAVVIFIVLALALRLALALTTKVLLKLTSKTKTDVDDRIIQKSSGSLTIASFLISLRISLAELALNDAFIASANKVVYSGLVIIAGYLVFVVVDIALIAAWKNIARKTRVPVNDSITNLVHGTLKITVLILIGLYLLGVWGVEIVPLLGALGIAGLAVALALQPVLANIFSGVSMILDKSVSVGDWVILEGGTWGVIEKIGIRSTKVKSFDNEFIIVPNTQMADNKIHNVTLPDAKARVVIPFGVAYGSSIEKVKKLISKEIAGIKDVLKDSPPVVRFLEMGDSSLKFKVYFHIESFQNRMGAVDAANTRIYNALNKAGIEIPFPQMDVHMKK